ncbi:PREDICTED: serine proteinase stubble-like isoform X2 [Vollenhovia emeryi]|nr:PREDICTED: serine proteinase stubble-like isoform X2 [Vollenhovia emeryi]XP_011867306.1 PREDICTED: serine proteinase stubble-like isoform X2 [Vollenhovia emeryi]XP_011867307.1 PREDICTED: serine proteinase stubble-like isoform X2 [Vollenhovia emeryi]XP_011867308.1 PREDICTED: serine proteinase stubble-like isoform X2 [Vollenhovia emeryi]XP_011867309.1 PREDICTED: serine proteinase stubble-like isoform X2 [Vollenhovia emeryi]XP_011867310.1 PREDICTED: serine proteinase stubble-like isoform X2 [V
MAKIFILIALLLHLFCTTIYGTISCLEYFTYVIEPKTRNVIGQIAIPFPPENNGFHLEVALNTTADLAKGIFRLELARSIKDSVQAVQQGKPLLYHVYLPVDVNLPIVSAIWFNSQQYCLVPETSSENTKATIELEHIVYPPNEEPLQNFQPRHRNSTNYSIDNSTYDHLNNLRHSKRTVSTPFNEIAKNTLLNPTLGHSIQKRNTDNISNNNNECGITSYYNDNINSRISNGDNVLPGQWPWMVALYLLIPDEQVNQFKCTGTVLTTTHIITVAHCLKWHFYGNATIDPDYLYVAFGYFDSDLWFDRGTINRGVASYKLHPDEQWRNADSDLAIVTLKTPVEYNPFIKPICLWSGSTNLDDIIGKTSYIVGWGKDKLGKRNTGEARMVRLPIVSEEVCHRSHLTIETITSNRTFCAGFQYSWNPCNADSGSGVMFFNATTGRYQLRGIVSRSVGELCSGEYLVSVDVAKYLPWIREQIST